VSFESGAAFLTPTARPGTRWSAGRNIRPGEKTDADSGAGSGVSTALSRLPGWLGRDHRHQQLDEKLERARQMGADVVLNSDQDIGEEVMRLTGKRASTRARARRRPVFEQSIRSLTRGGAVVTVGVGHLRRRLQCRLHLSQATQHHRLEQLHGKHELQIMMAVLARR